MNDNSKAHVNDVIKTMLERSSIRAYTDEKLTQEQISLLRNAALSAPTAMNAQDQRFVFVTNAEIIAELEAGVAPDLLVDHAGRLLSRENQMYAKASAHARGADELFDKVRLLLFELGKFIADDDQVR